jgi:hypothetical protein
MISTSGAKGKENSKLFYTKKLRHIQYIYATTTDQRAEVNDFVFEVLCETGGEAMERYESGHLCTLCYKGGCFLCIRPQSTYWGRGEIGEVYLPLS